jgi:hypothetical protein
VVSQFLVLPEAFWSFACRDLVFPAPRGEEAVFSSVHVFVSFVKDQIRDGCICVVCVWVLCSAPLVFLSIFVPVPCWFCCFGSIL